jgi:DNA-directed RNA polymerase specialized sigma24 family protein
MITRSSKSAFQIIEPVLQDGRVSDTDLVEVLVSDGYAAMLPLARALLFDPNLAEKAVTNALAAIVTQRRRYWGQVPLAVWANRLVIQQCQRIKNRSFLKMRVFHDETTSERHPTGEQPNGEFIQQLTFLDEPERVTLALRYGQGLTLDEIAVILDMPRTRARIFLKTARLACLDNRRFSASSLPVAENDLVIHTAFLEMIVEAADGVLEADSHESLERHLGECQACRNHSVQLAEGEAFLRKEFSRLGGGGPSGEHRNLVIECLKLVDQRKRLGRLTLSIRQYLYIAVLVAILVGVLWRQLLPIEKTVAPIPRSTAIPHRPTSDPWEGYLKFTYYVSPEDSLEILAERLGLTVEDIRELNFMSEGSSLQPGREMVLYLPESSFIAPSHQPALNLPPPLTTHSDTTSILERMASSRDLVGKLWGDYAYILYGPPGYIGPPFIESRMQVWWQQDGHMVMVSGSGTSPTNEVMTQYSTPAGITITWDRSSDRYWGFSNQGEPFLDYFLNPLSLMGFEMNKASLKVVGSDHILGRPTVVVDWTQADGMYNARVWIDAERGLVLRLRLFEDNSMQVALLDFGFRDLAMDVDLPADIFSPLRFAPGVFSVDLSGQPIPDGSPTKTPLWALSPDRRPRERNMPPDTFDPARELLALQWPFEGIGSSLVEVDVFAGEYYMGSFHIAGNDNDSIPFSSCTRSPDGQLVAISVAPSSSVEPRIYWFHLANPGNIGFVTSTLDTVSEFAFDPSSRYLAYYGCESGDCGIQIFNIYTGTNRMVYISKQAWPFSLAWSPDGQYLAFLGNDQRSTMRKIFVARVSNGKIVYESEYSWDASVVPPDSPTHSWGMPFPAEETIFPFVEGCRYPFEYPRWSINERLD